MRTSTEVSKTDPTIKKILGATVGAGFKGRRISVEEVDSGFSYDLYLEMGSPTIAFIVSASGTHGREVNRPTISQPTVRLRYDQFMGACLVVYNRGSSRERVTIYISELDCPGALSVATDALLEKNKPAAADTLKQCGAYAGIAMAIAEANTKTLTKGESGSPSLSAGPLMSVSDRRKSKSAAQLQREIDAVLGRRG